MLLARLRTQHRGELRGSATQTRARRALPAVAALCALLLVPAAGAAPKTNLTKKRAIAIFVANPTIAGWLRHYPPKTRTIQATYSQQYGNWTIKIWTSIDKVGEVATGRGQDATG